MPDPARRLLVPLLLLVVVLTFARALEGTFLWDDLALVQHNRYIKDWRFLGRNLTRPFWDVGVVDESEARTLAHVYYRPLVTLSFMLDHQLYGLRPWGFHLTNLLLHLLVTLGVYGLARRLVPVGEGRAWIPASVALLFAVHPSRAEAVTWISGRCDVMMTLFTLGALGLFYRALVGNTRRPLVLSAAWLCWIAALLCKETALVIAVLVPLVDLLLVSRGNRHRCWQHARWCHLPVLVFSVVVAVVRFLIEARLLGPRPALDLTRHALLFLQSVGHYGLLVLDPYHPSGQVGAFSDRLAPSWGLVLLGAGLLVGASGGTVLLLRRKAWLAALALLVAVLTLAPGTNLWPMRLYVLAAERFLYFPLAGLCLLVGLGLARLGPRAAPVAVVAMGCLAASWAFTVYQRSGDYADPLRFWKTELASSPGNPVVQRSLAHALKQARRFDEAERYFYEAYRSTARLRQGLGWELEVLLPMLDLQLLRTSDFDERVLDRAARFYADLVALTRPDARGRAVLQDRRAQLTIAVGSISAHRTLLSWRPQLLATLGQLHSRLGDDRAALAALREAAALAPTKLEVVRTFALVLARAGSVEEAQQQLARARELGDDEADVAEFGGVLAACAPRVRALRASGDDEPQRHRFLAELYMITRAPLRATRELQALVRLAPEDRQARVLLALELAAGGELERARAVVREARDHFGAEPGLDALEEQVREAYARRQLSASAGPR